MKWLPFFEHAARVFDRVKTPRYRFQFSIAGGSVQLVFANASFQHLLIPALRHLASCEGMADLTVYVWDDASSGTKMISPPWSEVDYGPKGEVRGWTSERFSLSFQIGSSLLTLFDREAKTALYWTPDFRQIPYWERGAPFLQLLQFWLGEKGRAVIHAAAVGIESGAVLLVGKGGSGKSTTALACLPSPLLYAGDDYCFASLGSPPHVYSLYSSAKADRSTLEKLQISFDTTNQPKELLFLYPRWKEKIGRSFPLRAICVPRLRGSAESTLVPCSAAEALRALAPSSLFQLPGTGASSLQTMAALVKALPTYFLHLGERLSSAPELLYSLCSS